MEDHASSKPTPGPWTQNFDERRYCPREPIRIGHVDEGRFRVVCEMDHHDVSDAEAAANARVIAALPEVYEALRAIHDAIPGFNQAGDFLETSVDARNWWENVAPKVRAALSKVEGK